MTTILEILEAIDATVGHQTTPIGRVRDLTAQVRSYFLGATEEVAEESPDDWPGEVAESLGEDAPPIESYDTPVQFTETDVAFDDWDDEECDVTEDDEPGLADHAPRVSLDELFKQAERESNESGGE